MIPSSTIFRGKRMQMIDARPVHHIEACAEAGLLRSMGDDPQLQLVIPDGFLACGFYRIFVEIISFGGSLGLPLLYVDGSAVPLRGFLNGSRWTAIIRVPPQGTSDVRLDPADREVIFQLGDIVLEALSDAQAVQALASEVARHPGVVNPSTVGGLPEQVDVLYKRYLAGSEVVGVSGDAGGGYADWVMQFDSLSAQASLALRNEALSWSRRPLISILLPVYNTDERWLCECLDSVRAQAYVDWELCIADDASTEPRVRAVLEQYMALDSRIRVCFREKNGHISASSNSALAMARGEFIALLDHDDTLPRHALFEVVRAILSHDDLGLVYSDEDKIDEEGNRFDPYFKPAWNPDLFLSQNFISHFGVYRTSLVRGVGGFRTGFEGSQDYDLALRCIGQLKDSQIAHIPRVLYHWRAIAGSTALALGEKNYAVDAGARALADHLVRTRLDAQVTPVAGGYRVKRALPAVVPTVELIIPTRDRVDLLRTCIDSILLKTTYKSYAITIVDNGSVETETLAYLAEMASNPRVKIIRDDGPFNYSRLNNNAVHKSDAVIIGLINNDIEVISPDWLDEMVSHASRPEVGAVGAMLYYPDDTIQHAGVILGVHGVAGHIYKGEPRGHNGQMGRARLVQNLSAVTAACLLVRREVWDSVGGLDEALTVAFNDIDFCLRIACAGFLNVWTPFAELYHYESATRGFEDTPEKKARFDREIIAMHQGWGNWLKADPAHNPNLALYALTMIPAFPPRSTFVRFGGQTNRT